MSELFISEFSFSWMQINVLITRSTNFVGAEESTNGFLNELWEPPNKYNVNIPVYKNGFVYNRWGSPWTSKNPFVDFSKATASPSSFSTKQNPIQHMRTYSYFINLVYVYNWHKSHQKDTNYWFNKINKVKQ